MTEAFDEAEALRKWEALAPLLNRMMERVGTEGEFPVAIGSSLAGDDKASAPYHVSHVIRQCLMAGTDHLHAVKVLVVDQRVLHVAAPSSLARGALENFSAAHWVLQPKARDERVKRALRWHAKNMKDAETAVGSRNLPGHKPLEVKLAKLDAVASARGIDARDIRRGYSSTETVEAAEQTEPELPLGVVFPWRLCSGDGAHRNSPLTLIEIPHPCGSADEGGSPSTLAVSDHAPAFEGDPLSHAHMGERRGSTCTA